MTEDTSLECFDEGAQAQQTLFADRKKFIEVLGLLARVDDIAALRRELDGLKDAVRHPQNARFDIFDLAPKNGVVSLKRATLLEELEQVGAAYTLERARYYLNRLRTGIEETRTNALNDINLNRWKEYDDIITDSLWVLRKRATSGPHLAWYWGNFVPQIPYQLMQRYTKKTELVIDPFVGSGTTLIECRALGRNGVGIELYRDIATKAETLVAGAQNPYEITTKILIDDSRHVSRDAVFEGLSAKRAQLLIMHPPYHDIVKFGDKGDDLCNAPTTSEFLRMFGEVVDNTYNWLDDSRYLAVVIGDKYSQGELIPLGFYTMQEVLKRGYSLKSIVVKNFEETRGKRKQKELWRYRALAAGFYVFKHEYILLFKKSS